MKKVYIFGASNLGRIAFHYYSETYKIEGFVDNDINKHGKLFCGLEVHPPSVIERSKVEIIIASSYANEIEEQLANMNFWDYRIFTCTVSLPSLGTSKYVENKLRSVSAGALIKSLGMDLSINEITFLNGGSAIIEYFFLKALAIKLGAKTFLEIGTWTGESIANLAEVVDHCISISLPDDHPDLTAIFEQYCDKANFSRFFSSKHQNIIHFQEDSLTFDYNKIDKNIDLVFIDGDHSYQAIKKDSENIFKKCGHENTIIIWHDFKASRNELVQTTYQAVSESIPQSHQTNLFVVQGTYCGIYIPEQFMHLFQIGEDRNSIYSYEVSIRAKINNRT